MALPTDQLQDGEQEALGGYLSPLTLSPDIATKSPLEKAAYYNTLLGQGYSDAQIRQAAGPQTDTDWSALQGLASGLNTPQPVSPLPTTVQAPPSYNDMVLGSLYQQILGRAPTAEELQSQGGLLTTGGKSLVDIATNLYSSIAPKTPETTSYYPPTTSTATTTAVTPVTTAPTDTTSAGGTPYYPPTTPTAATLSTETTQPAVRSSGDAGFLPPEQRAAWLDTLDPASREAFLAAHPGYLPAAEPSALPTTAPTTGSPEWFKQYIYAGGANDAEATRRGIDWVTQQGMRPQDAVNLWNQSLGTNFNVTDLFGQTGSGPELTNFGDKNSWDFGEGAKYLDSTGMIHSSGTYFQRGDDAIVSDELFWNPNSPTGAALTKKIDDARAQGQRPGVVVTPYAVFQGKATDDQLLAEIQNSGADFVALDPYVGWGVPSDQLVDWTKNFIAKANALGKEVKLVTQGFARTGQEAETAAHNQKLLSLPGVSEFINFGLEDAKDLQGSPDWVGLNNDYKQPEKRTVSGTGTTIGETGALPTAAPAATTSALEKAASAAPQNVLSTLLTADPKIADQLRSNYNQAFNQGEASTFNDPGMQVGDYTIRSMPIGYDFSGNQIGGGFQATKTATNDRGLPLETVYSYDDSGAITGAEVRYFTGGDSGVVISLDAQGNKIGEKGFDYSEQWKGAIAPLVSMAAMAFAGPVAQSLGAALGGGTATLASNIAANAIVRGGLGAAQAGLMGGDPIKGALVGATTGALGAGGAEIANTAAAEALSATGSQVAADAVRGAVQSGLSAVPGVIASGGDLSKLGQAALMGGVTSGVGSAATSALEGTGITGGQVAAGLRLAQELSSGTPNISAIANAAAGLVNNPDATVAAKAVALVDTISKAGSNPRSWMGIMEAANQLSSAVDRASAPKGASSAETDAFIKAKQAGASDQEAAAAARQVTGGDAIDRATARATALPITYGAIPEIEIIDEEYGDLNQAQKDAAERMSLKIGADQAATPEEAAALAKSKGYGMFTFGGNRYTLGASVQEVLAQDPNYVQEQAGTKTKTKPEEGVVGKVIPGWGREGNLIQGFNNATVGTFNQSRAAEILREVYGDSVDWVDQNVINAAASYVYANREDLLRQDLAQGNVLGIGSRGPTPQDITSVSKDYAAEGARVAGPAEVEGASVGYDANGVPIAVVKTAGTTVGKKMTDEERARYDYEQNLEAAREVIDPQTGRPYATDPATGKEYTFEDYQASKGIRDLLQGVAAPVMKGLGELVQLGGYATGSEKLTQAGADLEARGRSITPEIVRQGTKNLISDIQDAEGITGKGAAIVKAVINRPWETLAAVGDLAGTELVQEVLPFGASFAAGKAVSGAMKAKFGEMVAERAGIISGVTANATSDAVEAGLQSAQQVYNELRGQGFGHERASEMALKAGLASAAVETVASVVGEGPLMASLSRGIPGSVARTTLREGVSEFPAGYLQTAIGDMATNRLGTFDPNAALTGGYLEALAGGPTSGAIQLGANVTPNFEAAATGAAATTTPAATTTTSTAAEQAATGTTGAAEVTSKPLDANSIINEYVSVVLRGEDASQAAGSSVGNVINTAVTSGADVGQAASTAVGGIISSAASTGANVASVTSSSVSGAVSSAVTSGADVATVTQGAVSSAVTSAVGSGLDVNTAVNSAVGGAVTSAATAGGNVSATINSAVGSAVTSAVTSGADVTTAVTSAVGSAVASAVTSGSDVTSAVTSAVGSAVTSAVTSGSDAAAAVTNAVSSSVSSAVTSAASTGADVASTITSSVGASVGSAVTSAVTSGADATTAVSSAVTSSVSSAVNSAVTTGTNVSTAVTSAVSSSVTSAVTSAVNSGVDASTAINSSVTSAVNSAVTAAVNSGTDVNTAVTSAVNSAVNSAVTSAVNTGTNVTTAINTSVNSAVSTAVTTAVNTGTNVSTAINTSVNSAVNSAVTAAVNTGTNVSTAVNTAVNSAVTSAVSTAVNTGTDVNTAVNTAVNAAVTSAVSTATSTGTNVNTAVTTAVTSAVNAAVNSGVSTSTATSAAVSAVVSTGVSTSVATQIVTDALKGGGGGTPPQTPTSSTGTVTSTTPPTTTTTTTTTPTTTTKTPSTPTLTGGAIPAFMASGIMGGEIGRLPPQFLKSEVTQGYVDPFAQVRQAQEQFERDAMIQNIDPRLMQILSERMEAPRGGLAANDQSHYSYGEEESIDDILGGKAANYAKGGYVEPLQAKEGGMALPLLAKAGGLPTHKGGREDFKDGKHVAGDGDGQSDDIPAWLADGEFVFPADVVSALGNGSTKAGTDKLYEMMHAIRDRARSKGPKDLPPPALKSPLDYLKSKR